jgi:hypothetical protein
MTAKAYLYPENQKTVYGDRLDGIEEVTITDEKINEIVGIIKKEAGITDASINIQGKIVNINITASTEANTIDVMKTLSSSILSNFSDDEIAFYDFQFFIKNEDNNYNMIGYKNKKNLSITWSSDEIVSEVEENEENQ